jgi:hypothetical protein
MVNQFQVRLLEVDSLPQLEEIVLSRKRMGVHPISLEDARETFVKLSLLVTTPDGKNFVWGSFDGNLLSAVLVQTFATPCERDWLMSYLTVNPKSRYPWNYSKNGLDEAWEAAIKLAEEKGRTIIRWSLPLEWAQTQEKTKKTSRIWKQYTIHTYAIVKAGEIPTNGLDQWIAGKVKPYDVALKKAFKSDMPDVSVI